MITKEKIIKALEELKKSKKRNFTQSYELVLTLKSMDLKKTENQLDFYIHLHYNRGNKVRVAALVGPELADDAKEVCDTVILPDEFKNYDKKAIKKLAETHHFFVAQANIMPQVAAAFGRVLGPKGKMPDPKAGCVIPPKGNIKALYDKLQKTVRIRIKKAAMAQAVVGNEEMPDEQLIDNVLTAYSQIVQHLPNHDNNIAKAMLKKTMSPVVVIE